jgi:hypothetical protein
MSDFPSINDLVKKKSSSVPAGSSKAASSPLPDTDTAEGKFAQKMKDIDIKEKEQLVAARAASLGVPYIDLTGFPVSAEALRVLPETEARDKKVLCFFL